MAMLVFLPFIVVAALMVWRLNRYGVRTDGCYEAADAGTDRQTLKQLADKLGCSETMAAQLAINRLHSSLSTGEADLDPQSGAATSAHEAEGDHIVDDWADRR